MITPYLIIGLGAFLGANCRYLVGGWAANALGAGFPYGTLIINVSGSFVIGLFLTLITGRFVTPPNVRLFFAIGFLGAYTTFSTFTFESLALIQSRAYLAALVNLLGSVVLGMLAVALGTFVGELI
jgi:fluoride exporter